MKITLPNGYIEAKMIKDNMIVWSERIECRYELVKMNYKAISHGEQFTELSYKVLLEAQPFESKFIRLFDNFGKLVGEFAIISKEILTSVKRIRLIV